MMICPFALWQPVANHGGAMAEHRGLVVHVQEGGGSLWGWFDKPGSQVSSHFWVSAAGELEQYVDTDLEAWAQMAGNAAYLSVETEGVPADALTDGQVDVLGRLFGWAAAVYSIPLQTCDHGGAGLTTHAFYPSGVPDPAWGDHACPGPARAAQLPAILTAAGSSPVVPVLPARRRKECDMSALVVRDPNPDNSEWLIDTTAGTRRYLGTAAAVATTLAGLGQADAAEWPAAVIETYELVGGGPPA